MRRMKLAVLALAAAASLPAGASAQTLDIRLDDWSHPALRVGQDYTLKAGDATRDVLVIAGDATIDGRVERDVLVVFGTAKLGATAVVEGSFVVAGGTAIVTEGAQIRGDLVVVGGLETPAGFNPGGQHIVVGTAALGGRLRGLVPWLTRGLLWARPIVPDLPWVWTIALAFFLLNLCLSVVFHSAVRACATTLRATPLTALMTGVLVLLLTGPICVLLAVSVVGLAVVPFVMCALLVAAVIGRIGFAQWIGMSVVHQNDPENRPQSLRSFLIGSAIMCGAYMVPIVGFVTWMMAGVFGLGSATLAFFSAYRTEHPRSPRKPKGAVPAEPVLTEPVPAAPILDRSEPEHAMAAPPELAPPAPMSELVSFPRAAFLDRLAAFTLDLILLAIVVQLLDLNRHEGTAFLVVVGYHVGFWTWKATTLGGIICQLRVIRTDGGPLRFADALVRGLTGIFSMAVLGLGFLWILKDPERQAWHDRVAGTYVVKVPRNWPI